MIWKILGSLFLLKYGITLTKFVWLMTRLYLLPSLGFKKDLKKLGAWAGKKYWSAYNNCLKDQFLEKI